MKKLKYLKLFEAFQSDKLSKTLAYINTGSKNQFLEYLKKITQQSDFPLSRLSDDLFQYLPFRRALSVYNKSQEKPCQATSTEIFKSNGIDGEKCESGRIKRKWGSSTRIVTCERCSGTAIEPPVSDIQYIKFWFTQNGDLVCVSATDGIKRSKRGHQSVFTDSQLRNAKRLTPINRRDSDYKQQLKKIPHLSPVEFIHRDSRRTYRIRGYIYQDPRQDSGQVYFVHDDSNYDGSIPTGTEWKKFGRYSWSLRGGEFDMIIPLEVEVDRLKDEEDPSEWNVLVNISKYSIKPYSTPGIGFEREVEPAHFALILDLHKLKSATFKPASETSTERAEMKLGATKLMTDDEIKKQNIERYLKQIVEKSDITEDITKAKNVLRRFTGLNFPLFYISENSRTADNIGQLIQKYYDVMSSNNEELRLRKIQSLQELIKSKYELCQQEVLTTSKNLTEVKRLLNLELQNESKEVKETIKNIIAKIENLNLTIYNKLNSIEIETIEDLEVYKFKVRAIRELINNSDGYHFWRIQDFCQYLSYADRAKRALTNLFSSRVIDYSTGILSGMDSMAKIIQRL